jgi:hypothetical protein
MTISTPAPADRDALLLATLQAKFHLLRDRVRSVVQGYQAAAYIVGRPGIGKSFTVQQELQHQSRAWAYRNARMSPMGLFRFIEEHPEHVLVLDDIGTLFNDRQAMQILLAALDGQPGQARRVTYQTKNETREVDFQGGLIAISNLALGHDPLARALGSRVVILEHEPSDDEIAAFMRSLVAAGFQGLSPEEGRQVADFLSAESGRADLRLDLRCLAKACRDFRQHRDGYADTPWQDLVRSSLRKLAEEEVLPLTSKSQEIEQQRQRVREVLRLFPDDRQRQLEESRLKKSTFYIRLKEVQAAG